MLETQSSDGDRYFRLHLNQYRSIETITCLSTKVSRFRAILLAFVFVFYTDKATISAFGPVKVETELVLERAQRQIYNFSARRIYFLQFNISFSGSVFFENLLH